VEPAAKPGSICIFDLNATLRAASIDDKRVRFSYSSDSRAIVRFDRKPVAMEVDGRSFVPSCVESSECSVLLPRGEHDVIAQ
jgi:hypothetical protein